MLWLVVFRGYNYGKKYDIKTIKKYCEVSKLGISIKDIRDFFGIVGVDSHTVNLSIDDIWDMPLPAILFFKHGHYVVLEKISKKNNDYYFEIIDPSYGRVILAQEALLEKWYSGNSGIVIIANPNNNFFNISLPVKEKNNYNYFKEKIIEILKLKRQKLILLFALTLIVLATNWGMPLLIKENIDNGILNKNINIVWVVLISQFLFVLSNLISNNLSDVLSTKISLDINIDLKKIYFNKIFNLPIGFYEKKFKSDLIEV